MTSQIKVLKAALCKIGMAMDADEENWITLKNGVHVPVPEGETHKEATNAFLGKQKRDDIVKKIEGFGFKKRSDGHYVLENSGLMPLNVEAQIDAYKNFFDKETLEKTIAKMESSSYQENSPEGKMNAINKELATIAYIEEYGENPNMKSAREKVNKEQKEKKKEEIENILAEAAEEERKEKVGDYIRNIANEKIYDGQGKEISDGFTKTAIKPSDASHSYIDTKPLSMAEERLVRDYSGPAFKALNDLAKNDPNDKNVQKMDAILENSVTTKPLVLFRGIKGNDVTKQEGFASATSDFETAYKYSNKGKGELMELHVPEGGKALSVQNYSQYQEEAEILLPRNIEYKTKGYRDIGGQKIRVVEVVYPDMTKDKALAFSVKPLLDALMALDAYPMMPANSNQAEDVKKLVSALKRVA